MERYGTLTNCATAPFPYTPWEYHLTDLPKMGPAALISRSRWAICPSSLAILSWEMPTAWYAYPGIMLKPYYKRPKKNNRLKNVSWQIFNRATTTQTG